MSKFRNLMAAAALLFAASSVFVACSDDDNNTMGPVGINAIVTTTSTASVYWTNVSDANCDGYKVVLHEGGRDGAVVSEITSKPKETNFQFTGLKPNTVYTVSAQGIPSATSGFSSADIAYRQFMTAPFVTVSNVSSVVKPNKEVDADGNIVEVDRAYVTCFMNPIQATVFEGVTIGNIGSYRATLYEGTEAQVKAGEAPAKSPVKVVNVAAGNIANGADFGTPLKLSTVYTIMTQAVTDNASCWYTGTAEASYYTFTTPAN